MKLETISKYKKRIVLYTLGYFAIGYAVILGLYLVSSPGYIYNRHVGELIVNLAMRGDFWLQVLVWPLVLITHLIGGS
ncbi:MAG: hypothetical protein KAT65_13900 [Methanophagales archaeon]|nr:hypothetical protein [Methanophagales archaeon]